MPNLTQLNLTSGSASNTGTISTLDNSFGTAGTSNANVISIQGISGMTAISVSGPIAVSSATFAGASGAALPAAAVIIGGNNAAGSTAVPVVSAPASDTNGAIQGLYTSTQNLIWNSGSSQWSRQRGDPSSGTYVNIQSVNSTAITTSSMPAILTGVAISGSAVTITSTAALPVTISSVTVSGNALQIYGSLSATVTSVSISVSGSTAAISGSSLNVNVTNANPNGSATSASSAPVVVASNQATIAVANDATQLMDGVSGSGLSVSTQSVSVPTTTTQTIISAVASKSIRVIAAYFVNGSTANGVTWRSHSTTSNTDAVWNFATNGGMVLPYNPVGWFATTTGEALDIVTTASGPLAGRIVYVTY